MPNPKVTQIKETKVTDLKYVAIQALYLMTFGLASLSKWKPDGVPEGFRKQFAETWLASLPGGLATPFYTLALAETVAFVLFILSVFKMEWVKTSDKMYMRWGLILSMMIFVGIGYGLRLTEEFGATANLFFYFGVTLFALILAEREKQRHFDA
jgi:hypothetical protein